MHAALRTQPHTAPNMPPNGGGFGVVLRTFCGRPAARSSPPSPPQTSPVTAAHSAPANAGVTVTPAARPASCTPAPAQHGPARAVVSGRPVLRKLLLKWGLGWVSAAASAGGAGFSRYRTCGKIRSRYGADSSRSFGGRTPAPAHSGTVGCMWGLYNGGMGVGQLWLRGRHL